MDIEIIKNDSRGIVGEMVSDLGNKIFKKRGGEIGWVVDDYDKDWQQKIECL